MTRKMKFAIFLAYLPTLFLGLVIALLLVMYLNGWRIWILSPEIPTKTPVPQYQIMTEAFRWN